MTVNTETEGVTPLVEGADFYSSPLISPDGKHISFVQWFHPDMPWEGGETAIAPITADHNGVKITGEPKVIAGKRGEVSSQQPEWISDDKLLLLSDESGFLNPYTYTLSTGRLEAVLKPVVNEDFGDPAWVFGNSSYAILDASRVLISSIKSNTSTLYLVDLNTGTFKDLNTSFVEISQLRRVSNDVVVFKGRKLDAAEALVQFTISENSYKILKKTSTIIETLPNGIISHAQPYSFVSPDSEPVHCTYYPPQNPAYSGPEGEKPPCVVSVHGGPTSRTGQGLAWSVQYFTSRGFAW